MENIRNIIVIGASAGGIQAVKQIVAGVPGEVDAAVVVVIHVSEKSNSNNIAKSFQKNSALICSVPTNGASLEKGHLYVAPSGHQLMIKDHQLFLHQGPHENKYRPSIDVLFRSAAVNFRHRVIGIILTGLFEDGTSGMHAIKISGGICIVQDPEEAEFPDMPQSVKNKIQVDHTAGLAEIPKIIIDILNDPLPPKQDIPWELKVEAEINEKIMTNMDTLKEIGDQNDFVCPDCGGSLYEMKHDSSHRYRCYTGHVFTENLLQELQDKNIEESLWVSIRMLEEKENLLLLMARRDEGEEGSFSSKYDDRLTNIKKHIERLKAFLLVINVDLKGIERQDLV